MSTHTSTQAHTRTHINRRTDKNRDRYRERLRERESQRQRQREQDNQLVIFGRYCSPVFDHLLHSPNTTGVNPVMGAWTSGTLFRWLYILMDVSVWVGLPSKQLHHLLAFLVADCPPDNRFTWRKEPWWQWNHPLNPAYKPSLVSW